jgi:hypothetical protein
VGLARTVLVVLGWPSLRPHRAQPLGRPTRSPPAMDQWNG